MASSFKRQSKFVSALVDSYARIVADFVLSGDIDSAMLFADTFALAKKFRDSRVWYDWDCSSFEIFVEKFHKSVSVGVI